MGVIYQDIADKLEIRRKMKPNLLEEVFDYFWYFFRIFLITAIFFSFIKTSVFDIITVSGRSMYPSYDNLNQLYIDYITPNFGEYRRGDVVIIRVPLETGKYDLYIKRIVGLPGDTVIFDSGKVILVNREFDKCVVLDESDYLPNTSKTFKLVNTGGDRFVEKPLPADHYFVMGDNRTGSKDSRIIGQVERKNILGREFFRISPPEKRGLFTVPSYKSVPN